MRAASCLHCSVAARRRDVDSAARASAVAAAEGAARARGRDRW